MLPPAPQRLRLVADIPLFQSLHVSASIQLPVKTLNLHAFPRQTHGFSESDAAAYVSRSPCYQDSTHLPNSAKPYDFPWGKHDFRQIASLLRRTGESKDLVRGKQVHASLKSRSYDYNTYVGNCLVQMYGTCGSVADARAAFDVIQTPNVHSYNILMHAYALNGHFKNASDVFESMSKRNVVSWTTIISSAAQQGFSREAMILFCRMKGEGISPNKVTIISILEACTALEEGREIHYSLIMTGFEIDTAVATALITMYGRCGSLTNVRYLFASMPKKNVVSWGALITAFTENGRPEEALEMFAQMNKELVLHDKVIYICALNACASFGGFKEGQNVHAKMIEEGFERDTSVGNVLVTLYGRSGDLDSAMVIFRKMMKKDVISWSAIISACTQTGDYKEALKIFNQMKFEGFQPNTATHVSVLDACSDLMALEKGREIHLAVVKNGSDVDITVGNSLVNLYGKCGGLAEVKRVFVWLQEQDVISWNNVISACAQRGHGIEALENFHQMCNQGIEPNNMTFTFVIQACNSIKEGIQRGAALLSDGCEPDAMLGTPPVTMHGRWCGIGEARILEKGVCQQNIVASSAMVEAHTKIGHKLEARDHLQLNQINSACHLSGYFFDKMTISDCEDMEFVMDHYTCIIDILNRAGHLLEGEDLLKSIPNVSAMIPWLSLLCSCRFHGDTHRGQRAADACFKLDRGNASLYFEVSHLCTAAS